MSPYNPIRLNIIKSNPPNLIQPKLVYDSFFRSINRFVPYDAKKKEKKKERKYKGSVLSTSSALRLTTPRRFMLPHITRNSCVMARPLSLCVLIWSRTVPALALISHFTITYVRNSMKTKNYNLTYLKTTNLPSFCCVSTEQQLRAIYSASVQLQRQRHRTAVKSPRSTAAPTTPPLPPPPPRTTKKAKQFCRLAFGTYHFPQTVDEDFDVGFFLPLVQRALFVNPSKSLFRFPAVIKHRENTQNIRGR